MKFFELDEDFFEYIENNCHEDIHRLLLAGKEPGSGFPLELALTQIEARRKCARKLSRFLADRHFLFPSVLAAEQATHQAVALYHASLASSAQKVADLTAGLGIDAFSFADAGKDVVAVELDPERAAAIRHNSGLESRRTGKPTVVEADCLEWLGGDAEYAGGFDLIFIDPARRTGDNRRTYFMSDCQPNVVENFALLQRHAKRIMIKASPIVDIANTVRELPDVAEIHIVCVRGECKEVLVMADGHPDVSADATHEGTGSAEAVVKVVDLADSEKLEILSEWSAPFSELNGKAPIAEASELAAGSFLYDPNAGIHKLNCSSKLCKDFPGLKRIAPNTDLYVSQRLIPHFPGRIFRIVSVPDKTDVKGLRGVCCEVIARNYPLTADQLRTKLKVRSGDDRYAIACRATPGNSPTLLLAERLKPEQYCIN